MCKRKDPTDPLVRRFLKTYNLNLLPLPRREAHPGLELYVKTGPKVKATPGGINEIIEPDVELPPPYENEPMPRLAGIASEAVDLSFGLDLLGGFFAALGVPPGVLDDVKLGYRDSRTASVAFEFSDVTRDSIDPFTIGSALIGHRLKRHPWVSEASEYYVPAAFVRARSISVHAHDSSNRGVEVGAGVLTALDANVALTTERTGEGTVRYESEVPLAIAVELYDLAYDAQAGEFGMGAQRHPVSLMRAREVTPGPAFPADDDEALLDIEYPEAARGQLRRRNAGAFCAVMADERAAAGPVGLPQPPLRE